MSKTHVRHDDDQLRQRHARGSGGMSGDLDFGPWLRAREMRADAAEAGMFRAVAAELDALRYKIRLAVAALNQAPDLCTGRVTRAQADAIRLANVLAWTFLTDGKNPPSQRRASDAPRSA